MPKKFKGENSKAVAARDRKAAALHEQQARKQKEEEDAFWADDDKHVAKKQQRKVWCHAEIFICLSYRLKSNQEFSVMSGWSHHF